MDHAPKLLGSSPGFAERNAKEPRPTGLGAFGGSHLMDLLDKWKIQDAVETYGIRHWSKGYFGINQEGHVVVYPNKNPEQSIDLKELIDNLQARGIQLPILLRFTDILRHRMGEIHEAFRTAITEFDYRGDYC